METSTARKTNTRLIPSQWAGDVGTGNRSLVMFGADTLPEILAKTFECATYYVAMGYPVTISIEQVCSACHGTGETGGSALFKPRKTCKACKGNPVLSKIPTFPVQASSQVKLIAPFTMNRGKHERLAAVLAEPDEPTTLGFTEDTGEWAAPEYPT